MLNSPSLELALLARFIVVGILNSAFGYGLYTALIFLGMIPEIALLIATVLGAIFNFHTTRRIAFKSREGGLFFTFVAIYAFIYICNAAALRVLLNSGINPFAAQAALLPLSAIATFVMMRAFAFKDARR